MNPQPREYCSSALKEPNILRKAFVELQLLLQLQLLLISKYVLLLTAALIRLTTFIFMTSSFFGPLKRQALILKHSNSVK